MVIVDLPLLHLLQRSCSKAYLISGFDTDVMPTAGLKGETLCGCEGKV